MVLLIPELGDESLVLVDGNGVDVKLGLRGRQCLAREEDDSRVARRVAARNSQLAIHPRETQADRSARIPVAAIACPPPRIPACFRGGWWVLGNCHRCFVCLVVCGW